MTCTVCTCTCNEHINYNDYYVHVLLQVVETLIMRGSPICIEVNGMPKVRSQDLHVHDEEDGLMDLGEGDCVLIEKWVLQIINLKGRLASQHKYICIHVHCVYTVRVLNGNRLKMYRSSVELSVSKLFSIFIEIKYFDLHMCSNTNHMTFSKC